MHEETLFDRIMHAIIIVLGIFIGQLIASRLF